MTMLALLFAATLAGIQAQPIAEAPAPTPDQRAAAARLLDVSGASARLAVQVDQTIDRLLAFTDPRCAAVVGHDAVDACIKHGSLGRKLRDRVAAIRPELIAAVADVQQRTYASHLSIAELDAVVEFARTPAGMRFFAENFAIGKEASDRANLLVIERVQSIVDELAANAPKADTIVDTSR